MYLCSAYGYFSGMNQTFSYKRKDLRQDLSAQDPDDDVVCWSYSWRGVCQSDAFGSVMASDIKTNIKKDSPSVRFFLGYC